MLASHAAAEGPSHAAAEGPSHAAAEGAPGPPQHLGLPT
jgi:hypothetical protein